ncbi:MAG: nucleotide exchange factor GrpE [Actinobacteria bacterium]|nr:nucleotide exchange factor GrpE [Actinomycetota bacterium]
MEKKDKKHNSGNGDELVEEIFRAKKNSEKRMQKTYDEAENEIKGFKEEIDMLRKELTHYKKLEEDYLDRLKRLHADYDNYRKRVLREQIDTIARANKELIEKLLPVIDSFDQALAIVEDLKSCDDEFLKGVKMIYDKFMDTLQKEGVSVINPYGGQFNPHECEVAMTADVSEAEEGTVLEVLRKGYKLNDFLIRPAVVKVCKKS